MKHEVIDKQPVVFVIDDDAAMRDTLDSLVRSIDLRASVLGTPNEFMAKELPDAPCCLVLDVRLPKLSGLEFQAELAKANILIPIIFITGHGDIPMSVKAMKAGAIEFLTKPFRDQDLIDAIQHALQRDRIRQENERAAANLRKQFGALTSREKQIMARITGGLMNKQIAGELDISEATVKLHRSNVMRKMSAGSLADLVKMAETLQI